MTNNFLPKLLQSVPLKTRLDILSCKERVPLVSVIVSLYNYRRFILETLEKIAGQTLSPIELLVIDDGSNDEGDLLVESWLRKNSNRFLRVRLISHDFNSGLASARNTGFAFSEAPWIWVQDADNSLSSRALEQCYLVAQKVERQVAVIYPLLLIVPTGSSQQIFQGGGKLWQREAFKPSNIVDAMALVRRSAWADVGGYFHIQGGWEDYDFWCSLIDKGWTGVQCPQVLGSYRYHPDSMTAQTALPNLDKLVKILKKRHPWLECDIQIP